MKRPLLSLAGSEMVASWGERFSPGDAQGLLGNREGYRYCRVDGRRRVISPMPKIKDVLKSRSKNVTYS
jgi:hypothetical protein